VQVLGNVQVCADCVRVRARAGLGVGSFDHVKRDKRENMQGARRGALRGGAEGVEEREDDEGYYLHGWSRSRFFSSPPPLLSSSSPPPLLVLNLK